MARVLTCTDYDTSTDTCTAQAWVEQSASPWPTLTLEEGREIGDAILVAVLSVWVVKQFLKPSTHRRS